MARSIPCCSKKLIQHQNALSQCTACSRMHRPVIICEPILTKTLLIGQAPGINEKQHQKPFAWTAGKTLFKWFASIGVDEETFRQNVYMSAICRCFPGKIPKGGDRPPSKLEIETCKQWIDAEIDLLKPELILPVGKMAIEKFLQFKTLKGSLIKSHKILQDYRA